MKKKIFLSLGALLFIGGVGGVLALQSWLSSLLTRDSLVRQLESQWNCRADVNDLKVELWSSPAKVEIHGLTLSKRDLDANAGTTPANRKPIPAGSWLVQSDHLVLEVELTELLHQRLHVKRLILSTVHVRNEVSAEEGNLLSDLFRSPLPLVSSAPKGEVVAAAPAVVESSSALPVPPPPSPAPAVAAKPEEKKKPKHAAFRAEELGMSVVIDEARLEDGSFHELNHLSSLRTDLSDLHLAITEVDVDPSDLAHHNQCKLDLGARVQSRGRAKLDNKMQDVQNADFIFTSSGLVQPLQVAGGPPSPAGTLDVVFKKGSIFGGKMTFADLGDKELEKVKKNVGIDVSSLPVGGQIQEDMITQLKVGGSRVEFIKDARLRFPDYAVTLHAGSWLNGEADEQMLQFQLLPSDDLSKSLLDGVRTKFGDGLVTVAQGMFNDGQGHLAFDLAASGRLSKPKVELGGQAGALQKALQGLGGGLLKGLVK